jgi:hypothetical protein
MDELLISVGVTPINATAFPMDYLFVNALAHIDFCSVCDASETVYPLREYIFGKILGKEEYQTSHRFVTDMINDLSSVQENEIEQSAELTGFLG